jgi:uncharacterized pyridoxamine 5'-phosphate oxidase family protein
VNKVEITKGQLRAGCGQPRNEFLRENWRVLQFTVTVQKSVRIIIDTFHQKPVHYFITSNDEACFQSLFKVQRAIAGSKQNQERMQYAASER